MRGGAGRHTAPGAGRDEGVCMSVAGRASMVQALWPLLTVQNLDRSVRFYRDQLGFTVVGQAAVAGRMFWCRLERGGASIMMQQAEQDEAPAVERGRGVDFYFVCDDVDVMYAELSSRGVQLDRPSLAYYGMKQLFVPEPDGYAICFESQTAEWSG